MTHAIAGSAGPRTPCPASPVSRQPIPVAHVPKRNAADFERNLDAMARGMGDAARVAALSYLDIAQATEARGLVTRPSRWQRCRRRWLTWQGAFGHGTRRPLKRCFSEGLRCGAEASLRYYGIAPETVGLPSMAQALRQPPTRVCERVVAALERGRLDMAHLEMPHSRHLPASQAPGCACRAAFDSLTDQMTIYIAWFNGPGETSGIHHCVPLAVAERSKHRSFRFPATAINALPKTCATRGYAPFRYTADKLLEPMSAPPS